MHIGITGGAGVIGSILQDELRKMGCPLSLFEGDIRSPQDISDWCKCEKFTAIFHLAALVPVVEVNNDILKAYDINVGGTINLLNEIIKTDRCQPWFFYASTSHVYKSQIYPLKEYDQIEPISLYGETKYMAERICTQILESDIYDVDICCGRIFSFFHETQKEPFLYPTIMKRLKSENLKEPFVLYGADSVRDFLNAIEVVEILIKLMLKNFAGIINIASGKGTKIRDFVQDLTECPLDIEAKGGSDFLVANVDKLNNLFGQGNISNE